MWAPESGIFFDDCTGRDVESARNVREEKKRVVVAFFLAVASLCPPLKARVYRWNRLNEEMCLSGCTAADGGDCGHRAREPKGLEVDLKMEFLGSGVKGTPLF